MSKLSPAWVYGKSAVSFSIIFATGWLPSYSFPIPSSNWSEFTPKCAGRKQPRGRAPWVLMFYTTYEMTEWVKLDNWIKDRFNILKNLSWNKMSVFHVAYIFTPYSKLSFIWFLDFTMKHIAFFKCQYLIEKSISSRFWSFKQIFVLWE